MTGEEQHPQGRDQLGVVQPFVPLEEVAEEGVRRVVARVGDEAFQPVLETLLGRLQLRPLARIEPGARHHRELLQDLRPVLLRDAHQLAQDRDGQREGERGHQVDRARLPAFGEDVLGDLGDPGAHGLHPSGVKALRRMRRSRVWRGGSEKSTLSSSASKKLPYTAW